MQLRGSRRIRLLVAALAALTAAVPLAFAEPGDLSGRKDRIDTRIGELRERIDLAKGREAVLSTDIAAFSEKIEVIEAEVAVLQSRLDVLERDLGRHQARLARLEERYRTETRLLRLRFEQQGIAKRRLEERLVALYETDSADDVSILLRVSSLDDLIQQVDYLDDIARRDEEIADEVERLRIEVQVSRRRTAATRSQVAEVTAVLAEKTAEQRAARDRVAVRERALENARSGKSRLLASVRSSRHEAEEDVDALLAASAELAAKIRAAQGSASVAGSVGSAAAPAGGLIWPVDGPITSPFGPRWGRMHEGIDIGVRSGTPIRAAAAGTVIYAGWLGGYGQLVVVDHGGGFATAYAHQSAIYVTSGPVAQGQVVGAVGCTGHCFGEHLHFEVRLNGAATDPLGYL